MRPVSNPPNPWDSTSVEWLGPPPEAELQVYEEEAKSILARNDSPDVPFTWSVNPYRGCQHACAYCYARTSHQYLGWGAGTDFDTRIVAKTNAPELLREALARRSWRGEQIAFSGVTDCYQPVEATYALTRRCLEVCLEFRNPVGIITKGALVRRDIDVLTKLAGVADTRVFLSIPFADEDMGRALEPWGSAPAARFETLRKLSEAGVRTGVAIAPMIAGLNEPQIPEILERARAAGATSAFMIALRLVAEVRSVFEERLHTHFPGRARKVLNALEETAGGAGFGERMRGAGPRWENARQLFDLHCRRLGFRTTREDELRTLAAPPRGANTRQGLLFE